MLLDLDSSWLMMAVAAVAILAFIFSLGMDAIMKNEGFGPLGNTVIITVSFFLTILSVNAYGIRFPDLTSAALTGLGGAFGILMLMALIKAGLERM